MSLNPEGFRLYHSRLGTLVSQMNGLPQPIVRGRAAALGTLTAILNRIRKLAEDWETRAMTASDHMDVVRNGSTLRWLREDPFVHVDFEGVEFDLPENDGRLTYLNAIRALEAAQSQTVA
jgi:hypothetical protein